MDFTRCLLYAHAIALCCTAVTAGEADFAAFGEPAAADAGMDFDAFGKTVLPPAPVVVPPRLWMVNTHPGKTFTEDQLRAMYPGHRFPFDTASGVAAGDPFAACGAWGCPTTPTTNATAAGLPSTSWNGSSPAADTYIRVGSAGTRGDINGCQTGNCANAAATYAPQWRLRR